jgi:hypothetical protein
MKLLSIRPFAHVAPSLLQLSESFPEMYSALTTCSEGSEPGQHGEIQDQSAGSEWLLQVEKLNEQADLFVPLGKSKFG